MKRSVIAAMVAGLFLLVTAAPAVEVAKAGLIEVKSFEHVAEGSTVGDWRGIKVEIHVTEFWICAMGVPIIPTKWFASVWVYETCGTRTEYNGFKFNSYVIGDTPTLTVKDLEGKEHTRSVILQGSGICPAGGNWQSIYTTLKSVGGRGAAPKLTASATYTPESQAKPTLVNAKKPVNIVNLPTKILTSTIIGKIITAVKDAVARAIEEKTNSLKDIAKSPYTTEEQNSYHTGIQ